MTNTIQLQPHTSATIPLHIESPETLSARTAIEIIAPQSIITDSISTTLIRNDETGQILVPTTTLSNLISKKFTILETLEPRSFRDYVLTFRPIASLQPEVQRQQTPITIKYGIENIGVSSIVSTTTPTPTPTPSPIPITKFTPLVSSSQTSHQEVQIEQESVNSTSNTTEEASPSPQVLGITTINTSSPSAFHLNPPPKLPPIFYVLLLAGTALSIYTLSKNFRLAARAKKEV